MTNEEKLQLLQAFAEGWNGHDLDLLMSCMADDCVFEASAGPDVCGTRTVGREEVRAAFAQVFSDLLMPNGVNRSISLRETAAFLNGPSQARERMGQRSK